MSLNHVQVVPVLKGVVNAASPLNGVAYFKAPQAGTLVAAYLTDTTGVAASDTNYMTATVTNLSNSSVTMATHNTKVTGGSALVADTPKALTLSTTADYLKFSAGDVIKITAVKASSGSYVQACLDLHVVYGQG